MDAASNFTHWQHQAVTEGAKLSATTLCSTIKTLEIDALVREIRTQRPDLADGGHGLVVEFGCGTGVNLFGIHDAYRHLRYIGMDFVPDMVGIARHTAERQGRDLVTFRQGDVRRKTFFAADVVVTDRCLINLASHEEQIEAIGRIRAQLSPDGRFLMIENSVQALERLNVVRRALGLPDKKAAPFNVFLDENLLPPDPIAVRDFGGLHDVMLYGIDEAEHGKREYDSHRMRLAATANRALSDIGVELSAGQNRMWVWGPN